MGVIRRCGRLWSLALSVATAATVFVMMTAMAPGPNALASTASVATTSASTVAAATTPASVTSNTSVQMDFACALKSTGLMSYTTSLSKCTNNKKPVSILPGPVFACVHSGGYVYLVSALSNCPVPPNKHALTLPPTTSAVYFCANNGNGFLSFRNMPTKCTGNRTPVFVPVAHEAPVLSNIETAPLSYDAGTPPVQVTASLTVSSPDATTLASATVTISSGSPPAKTRCRSPARTGSPAATVPAPGC